MKIDNSVKTTGASASESSGKARGGREAAAPAPAASAGTTVQLSSLSGNLAKIEATIGQTPEVDSARVSEIKQAISEGRFSVDSEKVADGLIESVRQMLAAQPRSA
ncbi:MAG: flagellar biosynthesis anti-sigma factor FlgM [Rhodocyclaceae bacterium]|uniref:Negative regulator of flagellin synthesis n=1 Tax=Sphingomonas sp. A1 TaxID=90322 RepID=A0A0A8K9V2_9SPHN|nr:negative regulator of flagellin synthesis FlgM [Sphingomonas sp. A1]